MARIGQELKQEVGLGHFEGRGWRGFHHHATLCIAAYGFLISASAKAGVLPGGFHRIRHCGLFASGSRIDNIVNNRNNQPITHPQANHPCHPSPHRHPTSCAAPAKSP